MKRDHFHFRFPLKVALSLCLLISGLLLAGCAEKVGVRPVNLDKRFTDMGRSALTSSALSERTLLFLRQRDLGHAFKENPDILLKTIHREYAAEPDRDTLFALMELSFHRAKSAPEFSPEASGLYLATVYYAHTYLFDESVGAVPSPFHPYSRLACDFYNRALAGHVQVFLEGKLTFRDKMRLGLVAGEVELSVGKNELGWRLRDFDKIYVAYEFEPVGLTNHIKSFGVGVPLVAVRTPEAMEKRKAADRFLPDVSQTYGATLFLRFTGPAQAGVEEGDQGDHGDGLFHAVYELYDPMKTHEIAVNGRPVPLETDFTIPLAYMVEHSTMPGGLSGLLKVESWEGRKGLHMLQPYDPDKIPVVFVHGLMSSPETWLPMFNDLLADTRIRQRYQFWFFMYPTGNPILYSASVLRESLEEVRTVYDPDGKNPALNRMVLVGHSMGGLLSRLMMVRGGDPIWDQMAEVPLTEMDMEDGQKELMRRLIWFEPLPFVSRTIFVSSPHRGSEWASRRIGRIGAALVRLPGKLIRGAVGILPKLGRAKRSKFKFDVKKIPTGIDGLRPDSMFVKLFSETELSPDVPYHSIIGNQKGTTPEGTDGIVPYESAHLTGAVSEKIVRSGHSAHKHPLAIREVRRILLEHLDAKPIAPAKKASGLGITKVRANEKAVNPL